MTVVVTHTTPADGTFSATGAAAWDANHALTVSGTSGQVQFNSSGDLAGDAGLTFDATNKALTVGGGTVTASFPVLSASQTWNNAAVTFTGYKLNVTDTASNSASLLMDLQVGGASAFIFAKQGRNITTPALYSASEMSIGKTNSPLIFGGSSGGNSHAYIDNVQFRLRSGSLLSWSTSSSDAYISGDLFITRKAAANLRFGAADAAAPVAQTLSVQSVVAGTTNTAGANLTITGSQGTGTGAGGSIVFQVAPAGGSGVAQNALATAMTIDSAKTVRLGTGYTVATLPAAGTAGRRTYVTDALAPIYLGALTGGGAVVCPVFDNGTAWVSA